MLLTAAGILDLEAIPFERRAGEPHDGLVATFRSPGAASHDFTAIVDWDDAIESTGMIRPWNDRFGVYASHTYGEPFAYEFTVTVYDIEEETPVHQTVEGGATINDGAVGFAHVTMRGLPENLEFVEGEPRNDSVLTFVDMTAGRGVSAYSATISGLPSSNAFIMENANGTFSVWPQPIPTMNDEKTGNLTVNVVADGETLSVDVPYLVRGAPLDVVGRTIPTPYFGNGQPMQAIEDVLATFTDDNPDNTSVYSALVEWGDGSVTNDGDVWIEESVPGVFEVWGRHGFPAPGTYSLEVRVFEDEVYSRGSAVSTVTLAQPSGSPLNEIWARMYCDGSTVYGTGDPPLDFNVLDQNIETLGTTVRAEAGDALSNVIVGRYSGGAGATATAQVKWEPDGPWEAANATGGVITGSHTYTQSGSYAVSVILELHDTYVTGDPVLQECYRVPRVRSFLIMSGATIETPEPSVNASAVVIGVGQTVSASDLFAANDLMDNAVAMIEWGDGDQSLVEFVNGLPDGSHQYDVDGFLTARITVRQGERVVVTCAHVTVEPSEAYAIPLIPLDARSTALENENLLDAGIVLARITDTNPRHIGGLHDVLISWGDGTSSLGRIQWESGTTFTIKGDHSYAHSGAYGLRFHYRDQFDEVTFHGTIVVTAKSLVGQSIESNAAVAVEREQWLVGEFEIDDAATISRQYRAAVDWGDGTRGNAEVSGAAGEFTVWGEHTYFQPGTFEVTVFVEDGYGVQETVTIISTIEVAEAGAGKVTPINVVEFELLDWYESASGGGPGEPPPPAMGKSGIPLEKVDVVRGTGGLWRESKTGDLYKSRKQNGTGTNDDGDTKVLYAYWPNGEPAKADGGDLPGVPAVSHEMRIIWGDPKLDSIDAVDAEFQIAWPAITRMVADHLYEVDTYGASGAPHPLTGRVYGVDITREIDVADGTIDVTERQPVIHGFEDYPLDDVMLLTFTKAEFNETDTVAHINWGDGSHDTAQVIENPDHTLAVRLDHVYTEEGEYELNVVLESSGGVSRVATSRVIVVNRDLRFEEIEHFAAATGQFTGDVLLASVPVSAWNPPWEGLTGGELEQARASFRPEDMFHAVVDWGNPLSVGTLRVNKWTDALEIYGSRTFPSPGVFDVYVKLTDRSPVEAQFKTQVTVVDGWAFDALHRTNGFFEGFMHSVGQAQVAVNTGGLRLEHALDFDFSPGTSVGGDPMLVYDSHTAHPRPILEGHVRYTGSGSAIEEVPEWATARLTWNDRAPQDGLLFDSAHLALSDGVLVGSQVDDAQPVEQSGLFPYTLQASLDFDQYELPLFLAQQNEAEVIVNDQGDLDPNDAFDNEPFHGVGWGINLVHRLIVHGNRDLLWVDGSGYARKYEYQQDGSYENASPSDFGQLVYYPASREAVYTAKDQTVYEFNHLGLLTAILSPSNGLMQFEYDSEGRLIRVLSPDAGETTLEYAGFRLSRVNEMGTRRMDIAHGSSITRIDDVDGSVRLFSADGDGHVVLDDWGVLETAFQYHTDGSERLIGIDRGLGSVYTIESVATACLDTTARPLARADGMVTDPLARVNDYSLDEQGRIESQRGPDGTLLSGGHLRTWERNTAHKSPNLYSGPEGDVHYNYNGQGDVTLERRVGETWNVDPENPGQTTYTEEERSVSYAWHELFHSVTQITDELGRQVNILRDAVTGLATDIADALSQHNVLGWTDRRLTSVIDRRNNTTEHAYDSHLRLEETTDALGNKTERGYDAAGNLETVRDALGRVTTFDYDSKNRLRRVTDPYGNHTKFEYDASGLMIETENANGVKTQYVYDRRGFLRETHEAVGTLVARQTSRDYDLAGNLTRETDALNRDTVYTYDTLDRRVSMTDALGGVTLYGYNDRGDLTSQRDPLLRWTHHTYDLDGRRTGTIDALNGVTVWTYDATGNLLTHTDAEGRIIAYQYDALDRNTVITNALGSSRLLAYDPEGNVVSETDELGRVTQSTYDARHQRTLRVNALLGQHSFTYDAVGNLILETDELGRGTAYGYDLLNRRVSITNALNGVQLFAYDAVGNVVGRRDELNRLTAFSYDALNRLVLETNAVGGTKQYQYDAVDNLVAMTNERNFSTLYSYDGLNRKITETNALGGVRGFSYDAVGNLLVETDELARPTVFTYDALNRSVSRRNALLGLREFGYDKVGNLVWETDELTHLTEYDYDPLNRRVEMVNRAGDSHLYEYDAVGNLTGEADEEGRVWDYVHDGLNRRIQTTDPKGGVRNFTFDAVGNLIEEVNELARATSFTYDALNRQIQRVDAQLNSRTFAYDAVGNLIAETDELSRTTTYGYDNVDRKIAMVDALLGEWEWLYDPIGNLVNETDALDRTTSYVYDALDRRTEARDALNNPTTFSYDAVGNLIEERDAHNNSTFHVYDNLNRRTSMTDRENGLTLYAYDPVGNLVGVEDPLGRITVHAYDSMGRRNGTEDAAGGIWTTQYDAVGNVILETDANEHQTAFTYDGRDRRLTVTDALSGSTVYVYDLAGNLLSETDPLLRATSYDYDELNRRMGVTDPLGNTTVTEYDAVGNVILVTDPLLHETEFAYDQLNRLVERTDPLLGVTAYGYDAVGNRTSLTDPVGNETHWTYDAMNRVTVETNELGHAREFAYDELGSLTRREDRNGRVVEYDYDRLQRRTEERWLDGGGATTWTIEYSYDAASQLTGASDLDSAYTYTYDAVGNIEAIEHETVLLGKTVRLEQAFDAVGNRLQVLAKIDGVADVVTDYVYDALNRMTRIEQAGAAVPKRADLAYDAGGQFATIGRFADLAGTQSVVASGFTFDAGGRLTGLAHGTLATYGWTYDAGNRLTHMTSPDGTGDYTYDATDQLVGADYNYQTDEAYAFDANGNRAGTGYVTGTNNQTLSDGVYNYAYDAEGNRTLRTHIASGATTEYTWDHRNRLTGIIDKNGAGVVTGSVGYRYDPFNRRISKVIAPAVGPAELEHFAYDGGSRAPDDDRHIVVQFGVSGAVTHRYLHGPVIDQILADEQVDPGSGAADVLWPLTDHLGSVRDLAEYDDVTGITSIANHIVYGAFGGVMSESNANVDCAFGFTGRETDPESDLNYYRARYYDPLLGQFIGEDPIGFAAADPNLRRYVGNHPVHATDPNGLEEWRTSRTTLCHQRQVNGVSPGFDLSLLPRQKSAPAENGPNPLVMKHHQWLQANSDRMSYLERRDHQEAFRAIMRWADDDPRFARDLSQIAREQFNEKHHNWPRHDEFSLWNGQIWEQQEHPNYATSVLQTGVSYLDRLLNGPYRGVLLGIEQTTTVTEDELIGGIVYLMDYGDRENPVLYERRHGIGSMERAADLASHPDRWKAGLGARIAIDPWTYFCLGTTGRADDGIRTGLQLSDDAARRAASVDDSLRIRLDHAADATAAPKRGPGQFVRVIEGMSDRAAAYQSRITGRLPDVGYTVRGVKFDGFDEAAGILLDAKGLGYATFVRNGQFQPWFRGASDLVAQARRQLAAAGGTPIRWHFAEQAAADACRNLLRSRGITGIDIVVTP